MEISINVKYCNHNYIPILMNYLVENKILILHYLPCLEKYVNTFNLEVFNIDTIILFHISMFTSNIS